jgi:sugar fermentation stimulation protein A
VPDGFYSADTFFHALFQDAQMLEWPKLIRGTLLKRYKRFLADVILDNGHVVTALCQNTGTMESCSEPGRNVYLSEHNRPDRRLNYTWEMIVIPSSLVGVNTSIPNKLVKKTILDKRIKGFSKYDKNSSQTQ